jgi:hypothetical protein
MIVQGYISALDLKNSPKGTLEEKDMEPRRMRGRLFHGSSTLGIDQEPNRRRKGLIILSYYYNM